jgi:hypothetical protein
MPVLERIAPADALAARRSLRAQIARLEAELARIFASTYPPIAGAADPRRGAKTAVAGHPRRGAKTAVGGDPRRGAKTASGGAPRLLGLAELECARDDLAGRVTTALHARDAQDARQAAARALLARMYADPPAHKGAVVRNADLGLPGCTTYRVVPRLLTGWWRVKVSSGCPLPSAANVSRHRSKRRPRPKSTAPQVPPRAPRPARPRRPKLENRPKPPWHPFPLIEIAVLVGIVCIVVGLITNDTRRGRTLLLLGLALGSLGGLDTTLREHFAGYRRHTLVLALAPTVTAAILLGVAGAPTILIPVVAVAVFAVAFLLLRGAWSRTSRRPAA